MFSPWAKTVVVLVCTLMRLLIYLSGGCTKKLTVFLHVYCLGDGGLPFVTKRFCCEFTLRFGFLCVMTMERNHNCRNFLSCAAANESSLR